MKKLIEKISKWFKRRPTLREQCIQAYGEEFGLFYDSLSSGISIGGYEKTVLVLAMIEMVREKSKTK